MRWFTGLDPLVQIVIALCVMTLGGLIANVVAQTLKHC